MPVHVLGYTWAGVRTSDLNSSLRFFSDILALRCVHEGKGFVQFELPSGQLFGSSPQRVATTNFTIVQWLASRSKMCVLPYTANIIARAVNWRE